MSWKNVPLYWKKWCVKRQLEGAYRVLNRNGLWGFSTEALAVVGKIIDQYLPAQIPFKVLREQRGVLHTATIDALITDLLAAETSMRPDALGQRGYVVERLSYVTFESRHLLSYFSTVHGVALQPREAWLLFHRTALANAHHLDAMRSDEADSDNDRYFRRRYQPLWGETLSVYQLFASLAGFRLPPWT